MDQTQEHDDKASGVAIPYADARVFLREPFHARSEQHRGARFAPELGQRIGRQVMLRQVEAIGIPGLVGQHAQVEFGHDAVLLVADLPDGDAQPQGKQVAGNPVGLEHFQRRGMEGRAPLLPGQFPKRLENDHVRSGAGQGQGAHQAHRAGSYDHYLSL